jgi:hypothetical protein
VVKRKFPFAGKEICETWNKAGPNPVRVMDGKRDLGLNSW